MGKSKFNGKFRFRGTLLDPLDEGRRSFQLRANLLSCEAARSLPLPHLEPVSLLHQALPSQGACRQGLPMSGICTPPAGHRRRCTRLKFISKDTLALSLGASAP